LIEDPKFPLQAPGSPAGKGNPNWGKNKNIGTKKPAEPLGKKKFYAKRNYKMVGFFYPQKNEFSTLGCCVSSHPAPIKGRDAAGAIGRQRKVIWGIPFHPKTNARCIRKADKKSKRGIRVLSPKKRHPSLSPNKKKGC